MEMSDLKENASVHKTGYVLNFIKDYGKEEKIGILYNIYLSKQKQLKYIFCYKTFQRIIDEFKERELVFCRSSKGTGGNTTYISVNRPEENRGYKADLIITDEAADITMDDIERGVKAIDEAREEEESVHIPLELSPEVRKEYIEREPESLIDMLPREPREEEFKRVRNPGLTENFNVIKKTGRKPLEWTDDQLNYVKESWGIYSVREMSEKIGISSKNIYNKIVKLGFKKNERTSIVLPDESNQEGKKHHVWTAADDQYLKDNYGTILVKDMLKDRLRNRTRSGIYMRAHHLGLKSEYRRFAKPKKIKPKKIKPKKIKPKKIKPEDKYFYKNKEAMINKCGLCEKAMTEEDKHAHVCNKCNGDMDTFNTP